MRGWRDAPLNGGACDARSPLPLQLFTTLRVTYRPITNATSKAVRHQLFLSGQKETDALPVMQLLTAMIGSARVLLRRLIGHGASKNDFGGCLFGHVIGCESVRRRAGTQRIIACGRALAATGVGVFLRG